MASHTSSAPARQISIWRKLDLVPAVLEIGKLLKLLCDPSSSIIPAGYLPDSDAHRLSA